MKVLWKTQTSNQPITKPKTLIQSCSHCYKKSTNKNPTTFSPGSTHTSPPKYVLNKLTQNNSNTMIPHQAPTTNKTTRPSSKNCKKSKRKRKRKSAGRLSALNVSASITKKQISSPESSPNQNKHNKSSEISLKTLLSSKPCKAKT